MTEFLGKPVEFWVELQRTMEETGPDTFKIIGSLTMQLHTAKQEIESLKNDWFLVQQLIGRNAQEKKP